jgi:hypothetical protein
VRRVFLAVLALATACGARQEVPYHFRSPLLGSVSAPPLPVALERPETGGGQPATDDRRRPQRLAVSPAPRSSQAATTAEPAPAPRVRRSIPPDALGDVRGEELASRLRAMVGRRDETSSHLQLAVAALREIGAELDPEIARVEDGPALVALAERRGALTLAAPGSPLPSLRLGDLLVFDRVVAAEPASLVGVVVSVDERGVVEFVYLARGVVRRGFAFPSQPSARRDDGGRILNTFIRHNDGADPRGTASLAGELIAAVVPLDRLMR